MKRRTDTGPNGYRGRFSSVAELVNLSILVSRNGKAIFDNFYRYDTKRGTKPFYMADPTTHGWALLTSSGAPLLTNTGAPILLAAQWLCLFGDQLPAEAIVGVSFRISFSVVVMP
ncbi:hypothetical protein [Rhizobium herbae]